ncbi:hypothetical protein SFC23_17805 [Shouchella clausii]
MAADCYSNPFAPSYLHPARRGSYVSGVNRFNWWMNLHTNLDSIIVK